MTSEPLGLMAFRLSVADGAAVGGDPLKGGGRSGSYAWLPKSCLLVVSHKKGGAYFQIRRRLSFREENARVGLGHRLL